MNTKSASGLYRLYHTILVHNNYLVLDLFYRQETSLNFYWYIMDAFYHNTGLTNIDYINNIDNIVFYHDKNESSIKEEFFVSIFSLD